MRHPIYCSSPLFVVGGAVGDGRAVVGRGAVDMVEEEGEEELPNDKPTQKLLYHTCVGK